MKPRALVLLPIATAFACAGAVHAGQVDVVFVNPESYTDVGGSAWEQRDSLRQIERYLRTLGQRLLPAAQTLQVEVLEVDLAGALRPQPGGAELRVLTGAADFPRMRLRWRLTGGGAQRDGDERLADLDYTRGLGSRGDSESLFYEKRMLLAWFKARFVNGVDH